MINLTDKKFLEIKFAEDFASPIYPILANLYLHEGDLVRARKVCEAGLDHDFTNVDGKYILGKVLIAENKLTLAERWLKQVVNENPAHFNALRLLINVELQLKRSAKTIQAYISHLLQFIPYDDECLNWLNEINSPEDLADSLGATASNAPSSANPKAVEPIIEKSYKIVESMATFTMVKVLKSQKHFHQALAVLDILHAKGRDNERISKEKAEIQQLIKESTK